MRFIQITLLGILAFCNVEANEFVFLHTQVGEVNHDYCANVYKLTNKTKETLEKSELGENEAMRALFIDDMPTFCGQAFINRSLDTWAPVMIFPRDCGKNENGKFECEWCLHAGDTLRRLEGVGVEVIILYNRRVERIEPKPNMEGSGIRKKDTNLSLSFILADKKPTRKKIPYQSPIKGKYFNPEIERLDKKNMKIALWKRMYANNRKEDRETRVGTAALILTVVATITVSLGSRNAATFGYQTYLKELSKRKTYIAKFILRRAMEKKRIREGFGLTGQKVEDILQLEAKEDVIQRKSIKEGDASNHNNADDAHEGETKILSIRVQPTESKKESACDKKLLLVAFIGFIFMSLMLVVLWFSREYSIDIIDGLFILTSISLMVLFNPIVQKMPCGRKKVVWYEPKCCNQNKDDDENDQFLDSFYAKFLSEESAIGFQKKRCCQMEWRQIIIGFFCLGFGVIWYIFRMDYEHVWVLHMLICCCLICGVEIFLAQTILLKFQYVVFLSLFMLVYDIFMVHITPLFTKSGTSIMVDVAVKDNLEGNLPRVIAFALYFPDYFPSTESTCMGIKYGNILGLGDLFFAGIICEYIFVYELVTQKEKQRKDPPCSSTYVIRCTVAYTASLVCCFSILLVTKKPQPALEFIIPFLLITVFATAGCRGEAKFLWSLDYNNFPSDADLIATVRQDLIERKLNANANTQPEEIATNDDRNEEAEESHFSITTRTHQSPLGHQA